MSAALAAAAPAHASVESEIEAHVAGLTKQVTGLSKEIGSFFGFGGDQANNPTDPLPVPEARELAARPVELAPVAHTTLAAPVVPAVERAKPRSEKGFKKFFCLSVSNWMTWNRNTTETFLPSMPTTYNNGGTKA